LNKELCGQNLTSLVQAGTSMYLIKYFIQYFFQYVLANLGLTFCERVFENKVGHGRRNIICKLNITVGD